jgi:ABC-type multidrug transport system ATPase subunit
MADGKVLEFRGVTKIFGDVAAVSDFTAQVEPGVVTGFVGPNGAGKSTTLRILLGDIRPTEGVALIGGVPYARLTQPRRVVGAVLENPQYRPRRTAERHLLSAARSVGVPAARVAEVLEVVGLGDVGRMRIGGYSLGMRQRLGVAEALLGDPAVLVFDEPANGLDPEGIRWMRLLMRRLADEGRTVLMSSHVLSEVQQVADNILIISNGRLLFSGGIEQLADMDAVVTVDSPDRAALRDALRARGLEFELLRSGINVPGVTTAQIGELAAEAGVPLSSLQLRQQSLEDVFLTIVNGTWGGPSGDAHGAVTGDAHGAVTGDADADGADAEDAPVDDADAPDEAAPEAAADEAGTPEPARVDDAGAQVETVDELAFVPTTLDPGVAVDTQPLPEAADPDAGSSEAPGEDAFAFLRRPLSEIEKDVVAAEQRLIAASPEGEQPTPGWVPTPEDIPSPAEEDADDQDSLESADSVVDLTERERRDDAPAADEETAGEDAADGEDAPGGDVQPLPEVEASVDDLKPRPAASAIGAEAGPDARSFETAPEDASEESESESESDDASESSDEADGSDDQFASFIAAFEGQETGEVETSEAEGSEPHQSAAQAEVQDAIDSISATESATPGVEQPPTPADEGDHHGHPDGEHRDD